MPDHDQPVSQFKSKSGIRRVFAAVFYSLDGFRTAWRYEHAFRQELMIAIPGVILALLLPVSRIEKLALIASLALVLVVELLNSAIEAVVDRVSLDQHSLSKNAKDLGSAAVMLSFVVALVTWGTVLYPLF